MAMAGRQQAGEGMSSRDSAQAGMSFGGGLDHFLRRLDSANDAAEPVAGATSQASPTSNSIAALVSNYDDLSPNPVNPWQYLSLSNPASPISQREYFNHLSAHTSGSGGHNFQATEWNMLEELEQQRALSAMTSRAPTMDHQHLQSPAREAENSEAAASFMYEEAAAAAAWYRNSGYLRGSDAALYESLARLDTQASDGEATVRSWEQGMYFGAGAETVQDPPEAAPGSSTRSANSVRTPSNTSQSSGSNGDDSDEEQCMRKRKTPEPSATGEDGNDSARTSSEAELKKTAASLLRRRSSFKKPREPRYAIKTRTDVDIMDDGFKWRKYGQKAVKNSPHPRNYYRCTTPQCPVRKRVERSHEDSGLVITTYEGMHTHQAPGFCGPSLPQFVPPRPVPAAALFPGFPPKFSQLAALHQLRALQQVARLAQMAPRPPFPSSIRRAQQFLGLKQEPTFYDFMAQLPSLGNFQPPSSGASFLDRMRQQQMRGPAPPMDADLVRRVLEAEDIPGADVTDANVDSIAPAGETFANQIQSSLRSRVELERRMSMQRRHSSDNLGSTSSSQHRAWQPRHHGGRDDDSLVDGLLQQEMAQPNATRKSKD